MELNELVADLAAFADEEEDVAVDLDGNFVLMRSGLEIAGQLIEDAEGRLLVRRGTEAITYRKFLTHELARLDVFAERLLARRAPVSAFIEGEVLVHRPAEEAQRGRALAVLATECEEAPPFASRVAFITADAGHGKTALLREYQHRQASAFAQGRASSIFWHVDLQGRQLLRLSEALMGDLGDLRLTGMWMPSIVRLMRRRALVLAVDGFDELAAEQGGTDALGALASLLTQLGGRGVIVAAARRTFFDTEDYLKRAGLIERALRSPCQFDQLSLCKWTKVEGVKYLRTVEDKGRRIDNPEQTYDSIAVELGDVSNGHPIITRPFLLAQITRALLEYGISPSDFIRSSDDPLSGVAKVVQAFVHREVEQKWVYADTGEPYLSVEQHMELLADVAEEMYRSQKDRLGLDIVETLTTLLLDKWGIDPGRRQQILQMVRMHVLLVRPPDAAGHVRSFDHPEFRDYFIAYALRSHVERVMSGSDAGELARYLSIAQISDATARYVCSMLDRSPDRVDALLRALELVVAREWKPTFLQINAGTLVAFALEGVAFPSEATFRGRVVYSSLVLERSRLSNVRLVDGSFVNVSLAGVRWDNVTLESCNLGELSLDESSTFNEVRLRGCAIEGVRQAVTDDDEVREYAPPRIARLLADAGIESADEAQAPVLPFEETGQQRLLRRVLRVFNRTTVVSDKQLTHRFRQHQSEVLTELLPMLERHGIVRQETWKGAGAAKIWMINERLEDVLAAEGGGGNKALQHFWAEFTRL